MQSGNYQTLKWQGRERRALARYLKYDLGYNNFQIKETVTSIKSKREEVYHEEDWHFIMQKMIEYFDKGEYVKDIPVGISKTELEVILDQPTIELRNLLFVLTVYFKWARKTKERLCRRGTDEWVKEADLDVCRMAGLDKLRKAERNNMFYILGQKEVYKSDFIRRYENIFTLPFIDDKTPVIVINDYEEVLANLENYLNPDNCRKCSKCGVLIYRTSNVRHLCKWCAEHRKR